MEILLTMDLTIEVVPSLLKLNRLFVFILRYKIPFNSNIYDV